jgi:hypothetical protein
LWTRLEDTDIIVPLVEAEERTSSGEKTYRPVEVRPYMNPTCHVYEGYNLIDERYHYVVSNGAPATEAEFEVVESKRYPPESINRTVQVIIWSEQ